MDDRKVDWLGTTVSTPEAKSVTKKGLTAKCCPRDMTCHNALFEASHIPRATFCYSPWVNR